MEKCSVLIETTKSAEDKTSRWFDLPIDYELFRDLLVWKLQQRLSNHRYEAPLCWRYCKNNSVRRLNKLYFAYTDLSPEVQQAYKELIPYCGGVEDLLQESENFCFIQSVTTSWTLPVTAWSITLNFLLFSKKERNILIWKPTPMNWKKKDVMLSATTVCSNFDRWYCLWQK